jgi:hypothetical protein
MKTLSIRQPWAKCITHYRKRTENRSWKPPHFVIGQRVAIHTSKKMDTLANIRAASALAGVDLDTKHGIHLGCVIATAVVVGFVFVESSSGRYDLRHAPDYYNPHRDPWLVKQAGNYGWLLEDVRELPTPIPARGQLGLWEFPLAEYMTA